MNNLSDFQQALLVVFKQFVKYCEENGLTYYAAYGTLLGAIRHQGFIPWDDDIDVYMKREDYDKLIAKRYLLNASPYRISCILDGDSPYPFAKFYTTEGTIWEYKHFPLIIGPWIDIFPIDEGDLNNSTSNSLYNNLYYLMWKYRKSIADIKWKDILIDTIHLNGFNGPINLIKKIRYAPFKHIYLKKITECIEEVKKIKSSKFRIYTAGLIKEIYDKDLFKETLVVPFEDMQISIPNGYHSILTASYGDYMQLPPEEKRVSNHDCFYININENVSKEDILKQMRNSINKKAEPLSIKVLLDEIKHRNKGF